MLEFFEISDGLFEISDGLTVNRSSRNPCLKMAHEAKHAFVLALE